MAKVTIPFVDDSNFEEEVLKSFLPVFVVFLDSQHSSPLAKSYVQYVEDLYDGRFKGVKVDIDKSPDIYARYENHTIRQQRPPYLALFKDRSVKEFMHGVVQLKDMQAMLDKYA